uniref:Exostosin GT47 domain-containing protein n=1 Tax=Panagrolaimus sp. PS1159 TaxID=55785 RepID=A0AC35EUZ4_9BILA
MANNLTPFDKRTTLLFISFSPYTPLRSKALKYFKNAFNNNQNVEINEAFTEWPIYLSKSGNAKFILSPPGNGIDPHRNWEALSMGAVPIVLNQSEFQSLFDDMPVMVVNDWSEVTEANMEKFIHERLTNNFSKDEIPWRPKLWLRYWLTKIMNAKFDYIKHNC